MSALAVESWRRESPSSVIGVIVLAAFVQRNAMVVVVCEREHVYDGVCGVPRFIDALGCTHTQLPSIANAVHLAFAVRSSSSVRTQRTVMDEGSDVFARYNSIALVWKR